jgi:hypothetical protein
MNTNLSFISYEEYTSRFSKPDIIIDIDSQDFNDDWSFYIDPETITDNQRSQLRLKKFWSERNLNRSNIKHIVFEEDENKDENEDSNTFYKRCIITICCIIVATLFL